MIELQINEQTISVPEGTNVIDAAEDNGIYIPRFCYHRKLSVVANCRMCLVEVEGVPKPLPACATTATQGMKVFTQSKKALEAQRAVMEFLLINHPLDCPICDQGGECELQDQAVGFGNANSEYHRAKRSVASKNIGPLIATEMTRCIHCTRCIRVSEEICGVRQMGATGRGGNMEIGTYVEQTVSSELSGNMIDVCPVGALTSKPYAYHGRAWELHEHAHVGWHDCWGSNIYVHTRGLEYTPERMVMRVVPRENEAINENWLSDRDRFSYLALNHEERNTKVWAKRNGQWQQSSWQPALLEIVDRLKAIINQQGLDKVAALASENSTLEEGYLLQKFIRGFGCNNIDYRAKQVDFRDQQQLPASLGMGMPIEAIEKSDTILLVGSYLRREVPLANYRVLKAAQDGAKIMSINCDAYDFNYALAVNSVTSRENLVPHYAGVLKAVHTIKGSTPSQGWINQVAVSDEAQAIADALVTSESPCIFLGLDALSHPNASSIRALTHALATLVNAKINVMTYGANSAGLSLAGVLPHRGSACAPVDTGGKDAISMFDAHTRAFILLNTEVEHDSAISQQALAALKEAGLVVVISPFVTETMKDYADFILPMSAITETDGTFVNAAGDWQSFPALSVPHGDSKPAWKILRVLANLMELDGFDYETANSVRDEVKQAVERMQAQHYDDVAPVATADSNATISLQRWDMLQTDSMVRRSDALQETLQRGDA